MQNFIENISKMTQEEIVSKALIALDIQALNPMQQTMLDNGLKNDIILLSPTGSGKTLAFLLPLLFRFSDEQRTVQALIITPSRELALQIESVFRSLGSGRKVTCCYGGHPIRTEKKSLEYPPALLIATPGRLADHINRGNIDLSEVHTLILDEFDKSLELGFQKEMEYILEKLPGLMRRVLTSATSAVDIPPFTGINRPIRLSFLEERTKPRGLTLRLVRSPIKDKLETLYKLLGELNGEQALVFCNLRESSERVSNWLKEMDVSNDCFHGGMEQPERERALSRFRNGSTTVLVSTDLAARGLDIPEVKHVIHYHLPTTEEAYTHRNGRTARMNAEGTAYLILHSEETFPEYIPQIPDEFFLPETPKKPKRSPWVTVTINRGKRDKVNKVDVVGFLCQKGELSKEDIGVIEIKESCIYVAVKRDKQKSLLEKTRGEKIKKLSIRIY